MPRNNKSATDLLKGRPTPSAIPAQGPKLSIDGDAPSAPSAISASIAASAVIAPGAPSAEPEFVKRGMEIRTDLAKTIGEYAYWQRRRVRDVVNEALAEYIERHPLSRE